MRGYFFALSEKLFTAYLRAAAHSDSMKNTLREPFTQFITPTRHFDMDDGLHLIPAKAIDADEIDRRQSLPKNTLIPEHQRAGSIVYKELITLALHDDNPISIQFLEQNVAPAPFNNSAYLTQGTAEAMNRHVPLPVMADNRADWQQTPEGARSRAIAAAEQAESSATQLLQGHMIDHVPKYKVREAGRHFANSALWLANITVADSYPSRDAYDIQFEVRRRSLGMLERSRTIGKAIGVHPSLAGLADIDSMYSAWLRRNAPTRRLRDAIIQSQEESFVTR